MYRFTSFEASLTYLSPKTIDPWGGADLNQIGFRGDPSYQAFKVCATPKQYATKRSGGDL